MHEEKLIGKFFTGINYWGSESSINMWENFNPESIENDLRLLNEVGITHLRVFPLWSVFQPISGLYGMSDIYEYAFGEEPLPDTPAGHAGVSESAIEKFSIFCRLAEKYNMSLIVPLITGHMSFRTYCPPAFLGKSLLTDPTVLKWQVRFVKYFCDRFKNEKTIIAWELGNEPPQMPGLDSNPDSFYLWCTLIADAVKSVDSSRPVVSGLHQSDIEKGPGNMKTIGEMCDVHTTHPYNTSDVLAVMPSVLDLPFRVRMNEDIGNVPTFVEEFSALGYMLCSRNTEADYYRCSLLASLAHGCHGAMWWCAFDQGHLDYAPYRWNTIGSEYGFFDKDGNAKPVAEINKQFKQLLDSIDGELPKHSTNGTIIIPRDDGTLDLNSVRASYILAKQANLDMNFSYAIDSIPDSPLYIFPSISGRKSITKGSLDELLKKAENGAVLFISADIGLFRYIPQMTGVTFAYREKINDIKTVCIGDKQLPIKTEYFFKPESSKAEVIATDENGDGVLFKNSYGKGFVFFLTLPLEAYLANKHGAFYLENQPDYACIYRIAAEAAKISRTADSDNPYIRLTEHIIDDDSLYIFAINYNNKTETANLLIDDSYSLSVVYGNGLSDGKITLRQNDGILIKATKNN